MLINIDTPMFSVHSYFIYSIGMSECIRACLGVYNVGTLNRRKGGSKIPYYSQVAVGRGYCREDHWNGMVLVG